MVVSEISTRMSLLGSLLLVVFALSSTITAQTQRKCVTDLGFVLDQSSSINRKSGTNFKKILQFVKNAAEEYGISRDGVRAGVLVFSSNTKKKTRVRVHFNQCNNTKCFVKAVDQIRHKGGDTYTNVALKKAKNELFNAKNGHRPDVPSFAILIADGGQSGGYEEDAKNAANALKNDGIKIIAFGIKIEESSARTLLKSLAIPGGYYDVSDFSELNKYLSELMLKVCEEITPIPIKETTPTTLQETTPTTVPETTTTKAPETTPTTVPETTPTTVPETTPTTAPETTSTTVPETTPTTKPETTPTTAPETTPTTVPETSPTTVPETTPTTVPETTPTTAPETTPTTVPETTPTTVPVPTPDRELCQPAVLGFVLDLSQTTRKLHNREVKIMKGIVNRFDVRESYSQAGLVTFYDHAKTKAAIGQIAQGRLFNRMLDTISHTNGRSYLDKGLQETTKVLYGSDFPSRLQGMRKLLFVVTDGHQTERYFHGVDLRKETELLRLQGVKIVAIAMGATPNYFYLDQLVPLGERSKGIVDTRRKSIEAIVDDAVQQSCWRRPRPADSCDVSIGFVLDASGTTKKTFEQEKFALLEVARQFNLGPYGTQAAVASFSSDAKIDVPFNQQGKSSFLVFETEVENLKHHDGRTKIEKGLEAIEVAFRNYRNGLSNKKILVVITDGHQSDMNFKPVVDAAESLRQNGFIIHTISIRRKSSLVRKVRQFLTSLSGSDKRNWFIPVWSRDVQNLKWQSRVVSTVGKLVGDVCKTRKEAS